MKYVAAAGIAWEWDSEEHPQPDIVGPFDTEQEAIDFLRKMFPTVVEQTGHGIEPDSYYRRYVAELTPAEAWGRTAHTEEH